MTMPNSVEQRHDSHARVLASCPQPRSSFIALASTRLGIVNISLALENYQQIVEGREKVSYLMSLLVLLVD